MDSQARVFFSGLYSYRKLGALVAGFVAVGFGTFVLRYLLLTIPKTTWSLKALGAAIFVGGIGGALVSCGFFVLRRWFAGTILALEISNAGIRYGERFHSWEEVRWISGHTGRNRVRLFYQTKGRGLAGFDRPMPVDPNPSSEEFHELMRVLDNALSEKYPEVRFG